MSENMIENDTTDKSKKISATANNILMLLPLKQYQAIIYIIDAIHEDAHNDFKDIIPAIDLILLKIREAIENIETLYKIDQKNLHILKDIFHNLKNSHNNGFTETVNSQNPPADTSEQKVP